jgi:hypothetical protein
MPTKEYSRVGTRRHGHQSAYRFHPGWRREGSAGFAHTERGTRKASPTEVKPGCVGLGNATATQPIHGSRNSWESKEPTGEADDVGRPHRPHRAMNNISKSRQNREFSASEYQPQAQHIVVTKRGRYYHILVNGVGAFETRPEEYRENVARLCVYQTQRIGITPASPNAIHISTNRMRKTQANALKGPWIRSKEHGYAQKNMDSHGPTTSARARVPINEPLSPAPAWRDKQDRILLSR